MKAMRPVLVIVALMVGALAVEASGPLGIYGIVEKVIFEPSEQAPERIQVWGAFAYVDGGPDGTVSAPKRGYLYFRTDQAQATAVKNEWADLKAIAGTGQAVGFGKWAYVGPFTSLQPGAVSSNRPPYILERGPAAQRVTDLRVRPANETPVSPALYQTNVGVVKLSESGSHAAIVKQLKDALKR